MKIFEVQLKEECRTELDSWTYSFMGRPLSGSYGRCWFSAGTVKEGLSFIDLDEVDTLEIRNRD